jgi:hypothetical protein
MPDRSDWLPLKAAARELRLDPERARQLAQAGTLVGEKRGGRNAWFIDPQSLAKELKVRGGPWEDGVAKLAAEVRSLAGQVAALEGAGAGARSESGAEAERDQYRAEAATMREVATRANAAHRDTIAGFRQVLEAMEEQTNLVSELLGPRTLAELPAPDDASGGT